MTSERFAGSFAPQSQLSLFLRTNHQSDQNPWIADLPIERGLADKIGRCDYEREITADT